MPRERRTRCDMPPQNDPMPRLFRVAALAATCLFALCAASARAAVGLTDAVPVLESPPTVAGALDGSWKGAAQLTLSDDFTYRRAAEEPADVFVAQDADALDVTFVVRQRENILAAQQTNGSSVLSDDYAIVYLWPQGTQGFAYSFAANPRGTRYQTSSENSAYSPQWSAVGKTDPGGYTVTMRIPFSAIRSGGSTTWRAQFARENVANNSLAVWTYSPNQQNAADPAFAGTLTGVGIAGKDTHRPKPRAQIYALGEATNAANGGSTSRVGADLSLPATPTASLVAALHPDYSNVEIDQQTIAPNAFAYQYQEVRPFFTQVGQSFNHTLSCSNCPLMLYTPSIPTFGSGYALEGTQGPLTFAAFDTQATDRSDSGLALDYQVETQRLLYSVNLQDILVNQTGIGRDDLVAVTSGVGDQKSHLFAYANAAFERGSSVTDPGRANYAESGFGYASATTVGVFNYQTIGAQFDPVDSYVAQSDITGYEAYLKRTVNFSARAPLHDIAANVFYAWYHDDAGRPGQVDASENVQFDMHDLVSVVLTGASSAARTSDGEFLPFDANGIEAGYKLTTNTPSSIQYSGGPFYHGKLDAWTYISTLPVAPKLRLRLEADEDNYLTHYPGEIGGALWLERAGLDWQLSRDASFDVGVRRIVGRNLPNAYSTPDFALVDAGNVTVAFHLLAAKNEFYVVYGDPNSLATKPALYLKWIRYIGAQKGT